MGGNGRASMHSVSVPTVAYLGRTVVARLIVSVRLQSFHGSVVVSAKVL